MESKLIDNQIIYVLKDDEWNIIFKKNKYKQFTLNHNIIELFKKKDYYLYKKYPEILCGLGSAGVKLFTLPYSFFEYEKDMFQRIQIDKVICPNCNWKGFIGNPKVLDIYVGVPDNQDIILLMKKSSVFPEKKCPNCNTHKFKNAIWLGI